MIARSLQGLAEGFRHIAVDSCGSTNVICFERAENGEPGNLWITATEQTVGKASRGRGWVSKPGNLYSSLLLETPCKPKHLPGLTFVAAVSVYETIAHFVSGAKVELKWPNDVLVDERKCSGVLLENRLNLERNIVVIGMGLNCRHHPGDTNFPATDMLTEGVDVEPEQVFDELAARVAENLKLWNAGTGFAAIRENWLQHAWGLGKPTLVRLYDGVEVCGTFKGLDKNGHMILTGESGKDVRITVGDVFALPKVVEQTNNAGEFD